MVDNVQLVDVYYLIIIVFLSVVVLAYGGERDDDCEKNR